MAAFVLVLIAIATRVAWATGSHAPHVWWNFTAVGGSLLFFGARRGLRVMWVPVVAFALTDFALTRFAYGYAFHVQDYLVTWAWYAAAILLGAWLLKRKASAGRIIGASVASATTFFAASNFAVWATGGIYPRTMDGLAACYVGGLPFYRNDLVSTLLVTAVAFGAVALARQWSESRGHTGGAAAA
jgi:hypothetical protein